jgi:hypothetical protein
MTYLVFDHKIGSDSAKGSCGIIGRIAQPIKNFR